MGTEDKTQKTTEDKKISAAHARTHSKSFESINGLMAKLLGEKIGTPGYKRALSVLQTHISGSLQGITNYKARVKTHAKLLKYVRAAFRTHSQKNENTREEESIISQINAFVKERVSFDHPKTKIATSDALAMFLRFIIPFSSLLELPFNIGRAYRGTMAKEASIPSIVPGILQALVVGGLAATLLLGGPLAPLIAGLGLPMLIGITAGALMIARGLGAALATVVVLFISNRRAKSSVKRSFLQQLSEFVKNFFKFGLFAESGKTAALMVQKASNAVRDTIDALRTTKEESTEIELTTFSGKGASTVSSEKSATPPPVPTAAAEKKEATLVEVAAREKTTADRAEAKVNTKDQESYDQHLNKNNLFSDTDKHIFEGDPKDLPESLIREDQTHTTPATPALTEPTPAPVSATPRRSLSLQNWQHPPASTHASSIPLATEQVSDKSKLGSLSSEMKNDDAEGTSTSMTHH